MHLDYMYKLQEARRRAVPGFADERGKSAGDRLFCLRARSDVYVRSFSFYSARTAVDRLDARLGLSVSATRRSVRHNSQTF